MAIVLCLLLASLCVIKKVWIARYLLLWCSSRLNLLPQRQEDERFKKIDAKRGGRGFVWSHLVNTKQICIFWVYTYDVLRSFLGLYNRASWNLSSFAFFALHPIIMLYKINFSPWVNDRNIIVTTSLDLSNITEHAGCRTRFYLCITPSW